MREYTLVKIIVQSEALILLCFSYLMFLAPILLAKVYMQKVL